MGHGDCDPVVVLEVGRESCQKLMESGLWKEMGEEIVDVVVLFLIVFFFSGFEVKWRTYQGLPHALHPQELRDGLFLIILFLFFCFCFFVFLFFCFCFFVFFCFCYFPVLSFSHIIQQWPPS